MVLIWRWTCLSMMKTKYPGILFSFFSRRVLKRVFSWRMLLGVGRWFVFLNCVFEVAEAAAEIVTFTDIPLIYVVQMQLCFCWQFFTLWSPCHCLLSWWDSSEFQLLALWSWSGNWCTCQFVQRFKINSSPTGLWLSKHLIQSWY